MISSIGHFEAIGEVTGSYVFDGAGNVLLGLTDILRYNFKVKDLKLLPYTQIGLGVIYTDAYNDITQSLIGQAIEYTPQGSFGIHYRINRECSFDMEAMFHHSRPGRP